MAIKKLGGDIVLLTFQITLLFTMLISFLAAIGEKDDLNLRNNMTGICVVSIISLSVLIIV